MKRLLLVCALAGALGFGVVGVLLADDPSEAQAMIAIAAVIGATLIIGGLYKRLRGWPAWSSGATRVALVLIVVVNPFSGALASYLGYPVVGTLCLVLCGLGACSVVCPRGQSPRVSMSDVKTHMAE
jgi:hypothetical protein